MLYYFGRERGEGEHTKMLLWTLKYEICTTDLILYRNKSLKAV